MDMRTPTTFPDIGARRIRELGSRMRHAICAAVFIIAIPAHAADDPQTTAPTVGGLMRVVYVKDELVNRLTLNGKTIYRIEGGKPYAMDDSHVVIKQKFRVGANDAVLVQTNCGGSGCGGYSTLWFVTVTPAGKPLVSDGMDADEEGTAEVKVAGDQLSITTVTMDGRRKKTHRWAYANGAVKVAK
jgi:hypothetical protein